MSYDPACEELARHFLSPHEHETVVKALAQHIQDEVEGWLVTEEGRKQRDIEKTRLAFRGVFRE